MLKNYLLTTLRSISKRKGFTLLNILGLSIGLAASLLILQYVKDELSYDDFHEHGQDIYRVQYDRYRDRDLIFQCASVFNKVGVSNIFLLLSKDFLKLVVIANLIAIPAVWALMNEWLSLFAFHVDITFWIFIIAAVITTLIALVTVSYQSISAAIANPVKSLRYE